MHGRLEGLAQTLGSAKDKKVLFFDSGIAEAIEQSPDSLDTVVSQKRLLGCDLVAVKETLKVLYWHRMKEEICGWLKMNK